MAEIIPPPTEQPVVDPKTGKLTPEWQRWFLAVFKLLKGL